MLLFIEEMNEPVMVNQAKFFPSNYTNRVVHLFIALLQSLSLIMLKLSYIFGHVLTVSNRCYGRCYVQKLAPLCTFLKFSTYLEVNSARSI